MAYIPETSSVVAFQSRPSSLLVGASLMGRSPVGLYTAGGTAINDSGGNLMVNVGNMATGQFGNSDSTAANLTSALIFSETLLYNKTDNRWDRWYGNSSTGGMVTLGGSTNASVITVGGTSGASSVTAYQGGAWVTSLVSTIPSSVQVGASVMGTVPVTQTTTPWVVNQPSPSIIAYQLAGSVLAVSGSFSSGNTSVTAFQGGTWITSLVSTIPSSVVVGASIQGTVPVTQTTSPWIINMPSPSVIAYQAAGSIMAVSATVNTGNSSVQILQGVYLEKNATVASTFGMPMLFKNNMTTSTLSTVSTTDPLPVQGSVTAIQGTNPYIVTGSVQGVMSVLGTVPVTQSTTPWIIGSTLGTYLEKSSAGNASVFGRPILFKNNTTTSTLATVSWLDPLPASVSGTVRISTGATSVQLMAGTNNAGSITAIQGTNPWVTTIQANSIAGTYQEDAAHTTSDRGLFVLGIRNDLVTSVASANLDYTSHATDSFGRMLTKPFAGSEASVIAMASTVSAGVAGGSVLLVAAPGTGLRHYITDFLVTNTGATTTIANIANSDASVVARTIAPTGGGSNHSFNTPATTVGVNQALYLNIVSASSTVGVQIFGYKAP